MNIIKKGKIPQETKLRFNCDYCGTVFQATKKECIPTEQLAYVFSYKCECPICKRYVYV